MEKTEMQSTLDAGASMGFHKQIDKNCTPYAVIPDGYKLEDLEHTLPMPLRKRATVMLNDAASFVAYFKKQQDTNSTIYGRLNPPSFLAVLDDHSDTPGWRQHQAIYACPLSVEWKTWTSKNINQMNQAQFAQFIEDNLPDIVHPTGSDMLEISRSLEAKKKVNFASGIRLSNGQTELTYEEEVQGTAAKGKLNIPEIFMIGIPVLEGGQRYRVEARLRYRIAEGRLLMWYDLVRPHKILEDAAMQVWEEISKETGREIFNGDPQA